MLKLVIGLPVYVANFMDGALVAIGHLVVTLLVLAATLHLPYASKLYVDVKASRDAEDRT